MFRLKNNYWCRGVDDTISSHDKTATSSVLHSLSTKPTDFLNYTERGTPAMRFKAGLVAAPGFALSASDREIGRAHV